MYNQEREKELSETARYQQAEYNASIAQPVNANMEQVLIHPMKHSKHDHAEKRLPEKFVQRFALNMEKPPEVRDPFWEKLKASFGKNAFTVKNAIDILATDVKFEAVSPEELEQRLYTLMKFNHIKEV